jgi:hypothetical protein
MSYTISYEKRKDYLYAHITGPETYANAILFWESLAKKAHKEGFSRFLIVDEVEGQLTTLGLHKLSIKVAELFSGKKIAYVDPKTNTFDDNKYGETVVRNRGGRAKLFSSEEEGLEWLLQDSP